MAEFDRFLQLRGCPKEHAKWQAIIASGRLRVVDAPPADADAGIILMCVGCNAPVSTAPTIATAAYIDGTAFLDQQGPYLRLMHATGVEVAMGVEAKLRSSYLQEPIPGRKTEYLCGGPCARVRRPAAFSYRARRAGEKGELAVCWSCNVANETITAILDAIFKVPIQFEAMVKKVLKKPYLLGTECQAAAVISAMANRNRLGLLKTALQERRAATIHAVVAAGQSDDGVTAAAGGAAGVVPGVGVASSVMLPHDAQKRGLISVVNGWLDEVGDRVLPTSAYYSRAIIGGAPVAAQVHFHHTSWEVVASRNR
jgi:hypothetical protein